MKSYDDFFENLGQHESSGDYHKVNGIRFMGKYQMGEAALIDLGYYQGAFYPQFLAEIAARRMIHYVVKETVPVFR